MDIDEEMLVQLFMQEENTTAVRRQQQNHLILTSPLRVRQPFLVVPRRGGSRPGKRRNIDRHCQAGAMLLECYYFAADASLSPKKFRRRFRMNKNLFMKIVFGVREYSD
jgi:hypothetical protein